MAWIDKLPNGDVRAIWRDAMGVRRSASYDADSKRRWPDTPRGRKDCLTYAIGREAVSRDNGPQADQRGITWGQWSERWLELRRVEPATLRSDLGRVKKHLTPQWSAKRLRSIDRVMVQRWVNGLADDPDLSAATVARIYHLFSASMKAAVKARQIQSNPCQLIDLPEPAPGKERYLSKQEVRVVMDHLTDPLTVDFVHLLAWTGLRFGEAAGLHWGRVDMVAGTITVVETWDAVDGKVKAYPKSRKPRTVPLTPGLLVMLANRTDSGPCGLPHAKGSDCRTGLVFPTDHGRPVDYSNFRNREWIPALDIAGVPRARIHDLRHSFASWLAQDGVALHVIREMLGHATITTTERYSHIGAEQYARVLDALG